MMTVLFWLQLRMFSKKSLLMLPGEVVSRMSRLLAEDKAAEAMEEDVESGLETELKLLFFVSFSSSFLACFYFDFLRE